MFIPIPIKAKYFVIGYGLIELFLGIRSSSGGGDNIAHFAHLGGMLFGLILILYWRKKGGGKPWVFFDDLRLKYKTGQLTVKFIFINVALFLVVRLTDVFCTLLGVSFSLTPYFELPSDLVQLLYRPYTVFSYMFFQYDLLHLLFNMLWLYWFGQLFLFFFNAKQFGGVYILGGLSGAAVYLLAYNLLPYFSAVEGMLLGASAAVLAVVFAVSAYAPDYKIRLLVHREYPDKIHCPHYRPDRLAEHYVPKCRRAYRSHRRSAIRVLVCLALQKRERSHKRVQPYSR